jgi:hypothetical protein
MAIQHHAGQPADFMDLGEEGAVGQLLSQVPLIAESPDWPNFRHFGVCLLDATFYVIKKIIWSTFSQKNLFMY